MSNADLTEYRLDRLEKSDEKKLEILEKIERERLLEKQRDKIVVGIIVVVGSIAMDYIKVLIGM
jgi:hypothetical protein